MLIPHNSWTSRENWYFALMNLPESSPLEGVRIEFSDDSIWLMNVCLAIIMFSVALSINVRDFRELAHNARGVIGGLISQYVLLPLLTWVLVWWIRPEAGLALGMILIAACPGGNISNFFALQSRGNVALSVSLTVIATLLAPVMTPLNFELWGSWVPYLEEALTTIQLDHFALARTVLLIMVIPLFMGMYVCYKYPRTAARIQHYLKYVSVAILIAFIVIAFAGNSDVFMNYWHYFVILVFIQNTLALLTGYVFGKYFTGSVADARTISIETGIQNGGLGLVIVFSFFGGTGGMVLLVAWWGIWDIISGLLISQIYRRWRVAGMST